MISVNTLRTRKAHRIMYLLIRGDTPDDLQVCHKCDNPLCVNPYHLFLGTNKDNMRDKANKDRCNQKRENNNASKLTPQIAQEIRELRAKGHTLLAIGKQYGVSEALVCNVARGKFWN